MDVGYRYKMEEYEFEISHSTVGGTPSQHSVSAGLERYKCLRESFEMARDDGRGLAQGPMPGGGPPAPSPIGSSPSMVCFQYSGKHTQTSCIDVSDSQ